MKRIANIQVSDGLLIDVLKLPPDTTIKAAMFDGRNVVLQVEHPGLIEVPALHAIPTARPAFRRQPEVVFEGWGQ